MSDELIKRERDTTRSKKKISNKCLLYVCIKIKFQITLLKSELDPVLVTQLSMHFLLEKDDLNQEPRNSNIK